MLNLKIPPVGWRTLAALSAASALFGASGANADTYTQNFDDASDGETDLGDGSELITTSAFAGVLDGAMLLSDASEGSINTGFFLPSLGADQATSFKLEFDYSLFDESGNPADGFSLNIGPFSPADTGSEEGFGTGMSIEFDTYNNGGGENGHAVAVDGVDAIDGVNSTLPIVDGEFHWVEAVYINVDDNGGLFTLRVDDRPLFDAIEVDYVPTEDDIIAFAARTGGATETLLLDNLNFCAPAVLRDPRIAGDFSTSFGLVDLGSTQSKTLVIENKGAENELILSEAELSGDDAEAFTIDTEFPLTIAAGESAMVMISFNAPAEGPGPLKATLQITSNDSAPRAQERQINLSAIVIDPALGFASYRQNFDGFEDGTMDLEDGSEMTSNNDTAFVDKGVLQLTDDAVGGTNAGFFIPSLGGPATQAWQASFDVLIFDAEGGNLPADGFSFNWGPIEPGSSGSEEGFGSGLSVEFDTWDNGGGENGLSIGVDNADIPGGNSAELPLVDNEFHRVVVTWVRSGEESGTITWLIDGEPIFEDLETPGLIPEEEWTFAFAARTGGATETVLIDNLEIISPPPTTYEQDFNAFDDGDTDLADGSTLQSTPAGVASVQGMALRLTDDATVSTSSAYFIPSLGAQQTESFSADFVFSLFDAEGGNAPADGFSFNFGAITPGATNGSEEGFGTGLSIEFDTWNSAAAGEPAENGFNVAVDGVDVADGFNPMPVPVDGEFHRARIEYTNIDDDGTMTLLIDGSPIFENLNVPGFVPTADFIYAFASRTGGATETLLIDDLIISAPAAAAPPGDDPLISTRSTVNFGGVIGNGTGSATLTVSNLGASKELTIESAALTGAGAAAYKLLTALPLTIAPGATADLQLEVTVPNTAGNVEAVLALTNNDARDRARIWFVDLIAAVSVPGRTYLQNFDSFDDGETDLGDGSIINDNNGTAGVRDGTLILTEDGTGDASASYKTPVMGDLSGGWSATFDLAVFAELGQNPADGFSFNYGPIPDAGEAGEDGWGSGLTVSFDTWNNDGEGAETGVGLDIIVDGVIVEPEGGFLREDFFENDDGFFENQFLTLDGEFRPVVISWVPGGEGGMLTVSIDGTAHFEDFALPEFIPLPSFRFAWGARTGGATETLQLDNIVLGPGGPRTGGGGLQFSDVSFNPTTRSASITWKSTPGATYLIEADDNLQPDWDELEDGFESQGEETTFTEEDIPGETTERYYRVKQEP